MTTRIASATMLVALLLTASMDPIANAQIETRADRLRREFEVRREAIFQSLARHPLVIADKVAPIRPERGMFTRDYSYSIIHFAMKAFWLDEFQDEANAALAENCRFYMSNPKVRDEHDSFYWSADVLCRLIEFFGDRGTRAAGRLRPETEQLIYEMMWGYCHDNSRRSDAEFEQSRTWHISHSENHHHQMLSTLWHFSKFLAQHPTYAVRRYKDGGTPAEHYAAWTAYAKEYLRERVRKGLFIELASKGYNVYTLKGIYNCYDFADDPELRRIAGCALDVYWASWAQEQINGVRGGAASRVYNGPATRSSSGDNIGRIARFYLADGIESAPIENDFTPLTSEYRMPAIVIDMALNTHERGAYEIRQRAMGLAQSGFSESPDYRLRTDTGGIVRYAYCTPEFVLGTALLEARPRTDWVTISAQNRWHGVIFASHPDARIVPECEGGGRKGTRSHNAQWSAQQRGTLIVQKLRTSSQAAAMRVWFAGQGLTEPIERSEWVFVQADRAYAAVRPVRGRYVWEAADDGIPGKWLRCKDDLTPVIFEVASQSDFPTFDAFQSAVSQLEPRFNSQLLHYRSLNGDLFEFDGDQRTAPLINTKPIDYAPAKVFDSPYLQSDWNSGVVRLLFGGRTMKIDVNHP